MSSEVAPKGFVKPAFHRPVACKAGRLDEDARRGLPLAVAVVEPSGDLVAFARMAGVPYGSIPLAQANDRTSTRFRTTTARREEQVNNGR